MSLTSTLGVRFAAWRSVMRLSVSRGANAIFHQINLLASTQASDLRRTSLGDLQRRIAGDGAPEASDIRLNLQLRGFGSGSTAEMAALASLVAVRRPRKLLEFGTCDGASTWHLWANAPGKAEITTIDLPRGVKTRGSSDPALQGVRERPLLPAGPEVRLIEVDSRDWQPDVWGVEFCFIDAGHTYECVRNDTEKALSVMAPGGVVVWHDAAWRKDGYGVHRYLKELSAAGRDIALIELGPYDYCALAASIV